MKTFLIVDDSHPDFYIGQIRRLDSQIKPEMQALKIGDILNTGLGRGFQRVK